MSATAWFGPCGCCDYATTPSAQARAATTRLWGFVGFDASPELYRLLTVSVVRKWNYTGPPWSYVTIESATFNYRVDRNTGDKILVSSSGSVTGGDPATAGYGVVTSASLYSGWSGQSVSVYGNPAFDNGDGTYGTNGTGYVTYLTEVEWSLSEPLMSSRPTAAEVIDQMQSQSWAATYDEVVGPSGVNKCRVWDAETDTWSDGTSADVPDVGGVIDVLARENADGSIDSRNASVYNTPPTATPLIIAPPIGTRKMEYVGVKSFWHGYIGNEWEAPAWTCAGIYLDEAANYWTGVEFELTMEVDFYEGFSGSAFLDGWTSGSPHVCDFTP